jgi:ankyrin repeat protein
MKAGADPQRVFADYLARGTVADPERARVVEALLKAGADPQRVGADSTPPLHLAIVRNWTEAFEALLRFGADVSQADHRG